MLAFFCWLLYYFTCAYWQVLRVVSVVLHAPEFNLCRAYWPFSAGCACCTPCPRVWPPSVVWRHQSTPGAPPCPCTPWPRSWCSPGAILSPSRTASYWKWNNFLPGTERFLTANGTTSYRGRNDFLLGTEKLRGRNDFLLGTERLLTGDGTTSCWSGMTSHWRRNGFLLEMERLLTGDGTASYWGRNDFLLGT